MVARTVVLSYFTIATILASSQHGWAADEAPSFIKEPSSQIVKRNSRVRLKCDFRPKDARVYWTFNGKPLENTSNEDIEFRHGHLIINSFRSKGENTHAGNYRCFVETSIGKIVSRIAKLQVAYMKKMKFKPEAQTSMYLGGTALIKCTPPDSMPKAIIEFHYNGQTLPKSSDHYRVLPSGNLQIHNITEEDVGVYTCSAFNPVSEKRQNATSGTMLTIKTDTGEPRSIIYARGASVIIGENAILECVSEMPEIQWYRRDKDMTYKAEQLWGNLVIENVRKHDFGTYTCMSYSNVTTRSVIEQTVYLEVKFRPAIRSPPKDTSMDPFKTVSLKCSVVGDEDEIKWLFNTIPIDPLDTNYIANGRQLKIQELSVERLGMYQCYVENDLGSAQSSAEVKFSRGFELPSIIEKPINMTAIEGEQIFFVCSITGQPLPFMKWLNPHEETVRGDSRFYIDGVPETGGLSIIDVRPEDAGWYTCIVQNIVGKVSAKAYLKVIKMMVETPPTPRTTIPIIPPEEIPVSDDAKTSPKIIVPHTIKNGAVPNAPGKPGVVEITSSSVDIKWTYENNPDAPVSEFYIQKLTVFENTEWQNVTGSISADKRIHRIVDLTPGSIYRFRTIATNHFGSSQPSLSSHRFKLDGGVDEVLEPVIKPHITLCSPESTTSIIVEWTYNMEEETQPVEGFYVKYRADTDDEYETKTISGTDTKRYIIKNLDPDMLYDIKIQSFNIYGKGEFSNVMSVSTDEPVNYNVLPDFEKPVYKPPVTPKSPTDVQPVVEEQTNTADKEEILYICIGVILGAMVIIFIMFAGMCIWRSRQPNGNGFGAMNWSNGYYGTSQYTKGSQDFNNREINTCPAYKQHPRYDSGQYGTHNGHIEPRPLYMMPQDAEIPIDVSQYLSAQPNGICGATTLELNSQQGMLEHRHPSYVRPVKREDLRFTPNGIVCRSTHPYTSNGNVHHQSNGDVRSNRDMRFHSNGDIHCRPSNDEGSKHMAQKTSHNSLAHGSIAEDGQPETTPRIAQQRPMRNSIGETSNEDTGMSRSRSSSASSSHSTHSVVESDV
ncbi:cell adhesion molecule-related/down-regulated by oncogenes-like [Anneissia japonica]|uniref:cell adhesion molecule-related/down-regulated by oncogenes-like n=1 Tax=Anneissia japonica TaxID=1529436 RepID=UPI00142576A4|nr:cell adhesion molecule-related/down-regulated by oncogenes-like [Anneissia japonica]